jgi:hypothetical protein
VIFLVTKFLPKKKFSTNLKFPFKKKKTKYLRLGFSFLSLCHPRLNFFLCLLLALISVVFFFLGSLFSPRPPPSFFFFYFWNPFTYSPINLKCAIFISTRLPTYQHFKYVPAKLHLHGYTYLCGCHSNRLPTVDNNEERIKWKYCMELAIIHLNK